MPKVPRKENKAPLQEVAAMEMEAGQEPMEAEGAEALPDKPNFTPLQQQGASADKVEFRRIPVPQHRMTPLKTHWLELYKPITDNLKLDMRMNLKTKKVEIRSTPQTVSPDVLQKAADFVHAFLLGFEVRDAIALLRLDDLYIECFEIKDVKTLRGEHMSRAIGRLAGKSGKTKFTIENATRTRLVLADQRIHILGSFQNIRVARDALCALIMGSPAGKLPKEAHKAHVLPVQVLEAGEAGSARVRQAMGETGCMLLELPADAAALLVQARAALASWFTQSAADKAPLMKLGLNAPGTGFLWLPGQQMLELQLDGTQGTAVAALGTAASVLQQAVSLLDNIARKVVTALLPEAPDVDVLLERPPSIHTSSASDTHHTPVQETHQFGSMLQASCYQPSSGGSCPADPCHPAAYDWQLDRGLITLISEDLDPAIQVMGTGARRDGAHDSSKQQQGGPGRVAVLAGYTLQRAWGVKRACWYRVLPPAGTDPRLCLTYRLRARADALLCPGRIRQVSVQEVYHEFDAALHQFAVSQQREDHGQVVELGEGHQAATTAAQLQALALEHGAPAVAAAAAAVTSTALHTGRDAMLFPVFVHSSLDGRTRKYEVHPLCTVAQLRALVLGRLGCVSEQANTQLVYAGKALEEGQHQQLLDYGLVPESTLHLQPRGPAGK